MEKFWIDGAPVTTNLLEHVVQKRGISNVAQFLSPRWPEDLHDPLLLPDSEKASCRLWKAIQTGEKIGIVGDYDMDGTPAVALLLQFFGLFNISPIVILPTRDNGYGFSPAFVTQLCNKGVSLIITVDCGIRDHEAITKATRHHCDVIITDHHECPEVLPAAYAVINPKRHDSSYPFRELCGTGVAFKLLESMYRTAPEEYRHTLPEHFLEWSLDLVALATISDLVPLIDENRVLVYYGMKVLRKLKRLGLHHLVTALGLSADHLTYSDVSFKIIPKLNASGRLGSMNEVLQLLLSDDPQEVDHIVKQILANSTQCQLLLASMTEQAKQQLQNQASTSVIFLSDDSWHPGLTGLVAMRLVEEYRCPVGVVAGVDKETFRGSMRSIPGINLPDLLTKVSHLIEKFGGHEQAAGLTVRRDRIQAVTKELAKIDVTTSGPQSFITEGTIAPKDASLQSVDELSALSPWGNGNEEPLWSLPGVQLSDVTWLSDAKHLKARVVKDGYSLSTILFGAERIKPYVDSRVDVYGTLSVNEFRGRREPQFQIKGFSTVTNKRRDNEGFRD